MMLCTADASALQVESSRVPLATSHLSWVTMSHANHSLSIIIISNAIVIVSVGSPYLMQTSCKLS